MIMFLWSLIAFIVAVSVIIVVHEFGHFIVARLCKVKVLRFSLGFGKPLLRFTSKKQTEFVVAAIPLGGYVKMLDENEAPVAVQEQHLAFNRQSLSKRFAIVLAGPMFNFIFAIFAYWLMFMVGITYIVPKIGAVLPNSIAAKAGVTASSVITKVNRVSTDSWYQVRLELLAALGSDALQLTTKKDTQLTTHVLNIRNWQLQGRQPQPLKSLGIKPYFPKIPPVVGKVLKNSPGEKAGIRPYDKILAVNQAPINDWNALRQIVSKSQGKAVNLTILRRNKKINLTVVPAIKIIAGKPQTHLGIVSKPIRYPQNLLLVSRLNPLAAFGQGMMKTWEIFKFTWVMLYKMVTGKVSVTQIAGPVGIAQGAGITAKLGFSYFLSFLALISVSIGIINLLPVPVLDGGHILYYFIELVRGKPLSIKAQQTGMKIGLLFLIGLTLLAFYNDLIRILS
ncbi:MAG: RIP metalloprotease RseP [Pseudomonadota bacterium]